MEMALSISGTPIRLTYQRWCHITENHDELASYFYEVLNAVENPDFILQGKKCTFKAIKLLSPQKWLGKLSRRQSIRKSEYFRRERMKTSEQSE
ncbi:MAG: hypothetical protein Q9P90_07955 [candidate division KSB1 bacterium]|nr:hypothetical protein [candidate division KSB1 bacterium]